MFQVWKGEYLWCATGAEMGLYYREPGATLMDDFYNTIPGEDDPDGNDALPQRQV